MDMVRTWIRRPIGRFGGLNRVRQEALQATVANCVRFVLLASIKISKDKHSVGSAIQHSLVDSGQIQQSIDHQILRMDNPFAHSEGLGLLHQVSSLKHFLTIWFIPQVDPMHRWYSPTLLPQIHPFLHQDFMVNLNTCRSSHPMHLSLILMVRLRLTRMCALMVVCRCMAIVWSVQSELIGPWYWHTVSQCLFLECFFVLLVQHFSFVV